MFKKPIKIKNHTQIKGSERKNIKDRILQSFPNLAESDFDALVPKKEVLCAIKLTTASNETVQVFTLQKRAIVFDVRGTLFPTVYLLWKFPCLVPSFTTHPQVMTYLNSGADLMLPGVINKHGGLPEGAVACVNLSDNKAAVAVGVTAQSSFDMSTAGGRGKCLTIYHIHGDKLCDLEGLSTQILPNLGPPDCLKLTSYNEDFPELGSRKAVENDSASAEMIEDESEDTKKDDDTVCTVEDMDSLLNHCFFVSVKYSKSLTLPILTSNFYKLQMMAVCPPGKVLDIKKSSFKKLKPFLDYLAKENLITIKEVKKGVESITAINKEHPKFSAFYVEPSQRPKREQDENTASTSVMESYIITPSVLPIFAETGLSKGDTVQMSQIRQCVANYVKSKNCQNEENGKLVKPKEALVKICKTENCITWEELMEKVCYAMKSCYKVTTGSEEVVNKGKVSPITLSISQRSGNKKVTLIDNLECFGINIQEFAKECQHGVAASTSISRPMGKKSDQLLVQGNQILFVNSLLTQKYKIPAKYIRGLEHAPKRKN